VGELFWRPAGALLLAAAVAAALLTDIPRIAGSTSAASP